MRIMGVLIGAILGGLASYFINLSYAQLSVQGPERGFPNIESIVVFWTVTLLSILLGAIIGFVVGQCIKQSRVAPELKSRYRIGPVPLAAITILVIGILVIAIGIPMQDRAFRAAASERWRAERADNLAKAQHLLAEWSNEDDEARIGEELKQVFERVTLTQVEFDQATRQWDQSDWLRFAEITIESPDSFVACEQSLWSKVSDLTMADFSREKFASVCFAWSLERNNSADFWTQAKTITKSDGIWKNLLLTELRSEADQQSNEIPWWLYNTPAVEMLERLTQHHSEFSPYLKTILSRTQPLIDPTNISATELHERLAKITTGH